MSCDAVIDFVTRETGRFSKEIYSRMFPRSPWIGLVKKDSFPEGIGETISNLTYERMAPAVAEPTWSDVAVSDGAEGGACLPAATKIGVGSTVRSYNLKRRALEGPDFCVEELRTPFQISKQLESILSILTEYALIEWEIRYRHEYARHCGRKVSVIAAGPFEKSNANGTFTPTSSDTSTNADANLPQGLLNRYKQKLIRDGAAGSALGKENGSGILTLICSAETADRLIFENADIRQDIRWGKPNELLAPYGVERSYRGFYHLHDEFPMRFTASGGNYTEVPAFSIAAATKGQKADVNASWETATTEGSVLFDPTVFTARIPKPITNPSPGFKFDPVDYSGHWSLKNILDRVCNPDGTIVFHRGILAMGSEPVHPERGVLFLHKRCDGPVSFTTAC